MRLGAVRWRACHVALCWPQVWPAAASLPRAKPGGGLSRQAGDLLPRRVRQPPCVCSAVLLVCRDCPRKPHLAGSFLSPQKQLDPLSIPCSQFSPQTGSPPCMESVHNPRTGSSPSLGIHPGTLSSESTSIPFPHSPEIVSATCHGGGRYLKKLGTRGESGPSGVRGCGGNCLVLKICLFILDERENSGRRQYSFYHERLCLLPVVPQGAHAFCTGFADPPPPRPRPQVPSQRTRAPSLTRAGDISILASRTCRLLPPPAPARSQWAP